VFTGTEKVFSCLITSSLIKLVLGFLEKVIGGSQYKVQDRKEKAYKEWVRRN
jgi:hypothetical protein